MRLKFISTRLATVLMLSLGFMTPSAAQQKNAPDSDHAVKCTRLISALEKDLKRAEPRLRNADGAKNRQFIQSQLLFELLSGKDAQRSITQTLACLSSGRE